jgi:segregation and condensation protein B
MSLPGEIVRAVEAMLFAADRPQSARDLMVRLGEGAASLADVRAALAEIAARHAGTGIELVERGGNWHFQTPADLAHLLRRERDEVRKLSRAATEVLAIIAYHEPVSRAEIEAIRGVQTAKGTLDVLMEAGWIAPAGRREVPGRPLIYKTTDDFLTHFGLASRKDLPGIEDLRAAGLLDPVDTAFEALFDSPIDDAELVKDGEAP